MLILLLILFFVTLYLNILGVAPEKGQDPPDWRSAFLVAACIGGATLTVITEGLSLINGISQLGVAILWTVALSLAIAVGITKGTFLRTLNRIKAFRISLKVLDALILAIVIMLVLTLGVVAWVSPPNNTDSLLYHMPRVVHWIQNKSLEHYPTAYLHQLWASPFAELSILHFHLLYGDEQPANMIQWLSMVGSLLALTSIASRMGLNCRYQLFSAAFIASLPIGILQSTSTQNDYVTAFWFLCLTYFVVLSKQRPLQFIEWLCLSLATGLGMLTKGTFYPYAFPILLWFFIPLLLKKRSKEVVLKGLSVAIVVVALNSCFWVRNTISFGGPLGPGEAVQKHTDINLNPQTWISAVVRQVSLNFATPWEAINTRIISSVRDLDQSLGTERPVFNLIWSWNHEDLAGNPVHLLAIFIAIPIVIWTARKTGNKRLLHFTLVFLASFFVYAVVVTFDVFGVRYQLPFFVLGSLLIGIPFSQVRFRRTSGILALAFLFLSTPWVLFNSTRPIIGMRPFPEPMAISCKLGCTSIGSVFTRSRLDLLYANWIPLREPITSAAELVKDSGCQEIGLKIDSQHKEYLFLWSLGAAEGDVRVEIVYPLPESEQYIDPDFKPCAVVCSICGDTTRIYGLMRAGAFDEGISVFMGPGFTYDEDD